MQAVIDFLKAGKGSSSTAGIGQGDSAAEQDNRISAGGYIAGHRANYLLPAGLIM
ncbi:MAG: hypothetical protein R3D29_14710 [Nitratireductor sp.]